MIGTGLSRLEKIALAGSWNVLIPLNQRLIASIR
jgi:hypothetical protein